MLRSRTVQYINTYARICKTCMNDKLVWAMTIMNDYLIDSLVVV